MRLVPLFAAVFALAACSTTEHAEHQVAAAPANVYLKYTNPDSAGSSDVSIVNDTASPVTVRYERTVHNGSAKPTKSSVSVQAHSREWIGRTCAFDVQYQTVCGSSVTYRML